MAITAKQIRLIQTAKRFLRLEDEDYRALLRAFGGVGSSRDLDKEGADAVIAELERMGFRNTSKARNFGDRAGMASPAQIAHLRRLWSEWTAGEGTDASLGHWLEGNQRISSIRFLDYSKAQRAIGALHQMLIRKHGKGAA
jgi:phage gp16-like protein